MLSEPASWLSRSHRPDPDGRRRLAEQHDERTEQRRYPGLEMLAKSRLHDITRTWTDTQAVAIPAITA
jgi:hypothetical protein